MSMTKPEVYESVLRWLQKLEAKAKSLDFSKSQTKRAALYWLKVYCKFVETNPDTLISERGRNLQSKDQMVRRQHEEHVEAFIIKMKSHGYAPNTIATATGLIRSFYKANYGALEEVSSVRAYNIRAFKVPTVKDIKKMVSNADLPIKTWILSQKDSGLANTDLLSLSSSNLSSEFGTIKTQLRKGIVPVHVEIRRQKTGERTHSFFGPNAIEGLNESMNNGSGGRIFRMSMRSIQQKVKALGIQAHVATKDVPITSYSLRKHFNTYMKLAGVNEAIVELMMGHSIGKVRSAYLVTGHGDVGTGIPISKLAEIYMQAYSIIDINQV